MIAREFDEEPGDRTDHQVHTDDLAGCVRFAESPIQKSENQRFGAGLVELRRMQRNLKWHSSKRVSLGVVKLHGPGHFRLCAPAASGGEAAELSDGVTQG